MGGDIHGTRSQQMKTEVTEMPQWDMDKAPKRPPNTDAHHQLHSLAQLPTEPKVQWL